MFRLQYGVTFGELHSWRDLGLAMEERQDAGSPSAQLLLDEVQGRNGPLDQSQALTGDVTYNAREMSFSFFLRDPAKDWAWRYSEIANALHGQRMRIICDDDPYFFYEGRVSVDPVKSSRYLGRIVIKATADPYKYERFSSVEDWLWNPFDFRVGVIRNYGRLKADGSLDPANSIEVDGETELTVIGSPMPVVPTFYAKSTDGNGITVTFEGTSYELFLRGANNTIIEGPQSGPVLITSGGAEFDWKTGGLRLPEILIRDRTYELTFEGAGHVAVEYRGGRL